LRDSEFPITAAMGLSVLNASDIDPTQDEIIDYIVDLLDELQDLARSNGLAGLAKVLEAAHEAAIRDVAAVGHAEPPRS